MGTYFAFLNLTISERLTREGNAEGPLFGEVVVFTGALSMPRRKAADAAADAGCEVAGGVTKKTTLLIVGDQDVTKLAGHSKSSKHRKAEDGPIPIRYPLSETQSSEYHVRTQRNVETSSATLIITRGTPIGGTRFTAEIARSIRRPLLILDIGRSDDEEAIACIVHWLEEIRPSVLNIAGPRESGAPGAMSTKTRRSIG